MWQYSLVIGIAGISAVTALPMVAELMNGALAITVYQQLQLLYIDSIEQPLINGNTSNQPDRVELTETNRLIAVKAAGDRTCGGLLASIGDAYVLTNGTWRCYEYADKDWERLGYNDSWWPYAFEFGRNADGHTECSQPQVIQDISANAKWIWVSDQTEFEIFCRGYIPVCESSPCQNNGTCLQNNVGICRCLPQFTGTYCETDLNKIGLVITAFQSLGEVYIDGQTVALPNASNWTLTDHIALPPMSRLISFKGLMAIDSPCAGVLASVNDTYLVTNNLCKCSPYNDLNWEQPGYDDSLWPSAVEYGSNGNHLTCTEQMHFTDISSSAQWIWTDEPSDFIVYCRGYLPLCQTLSPCLNGGTCLPNEKRMCDCTPQFTGTYCESTLCETASPCLNGGTCLSNENRMCDCTPEFTGTYCESTVCDSSPCQNNGTCLQNDPIICHCLQQFTGTYCETDICTTAVSSPSGNSDSVKAVATAMGVLLGISVATNIILLVFLIRKQAPNLFKRTDHTAHPEILNHSESPIPSAYEELRRADENRLQPTTYEKLSHAPPSYMNHVT